MSESELKGSQEIFLAVSPGNKKQGNALLFHGLTGTPSEMLSLAQYLNDRNFEVLVPRLTGHGKSMEELRITQPSAWLEDTKRALARFTDIDNFPFAVVGLSFGALLACIVAESMPSKVQKLVLLSPPLKLKSNLKEKLLAVLTRMPASFLNMLPSVAKRKRDPKCHLLPHNSFTSHSVAAVARLVGIRNIVKAKFNEISADILVLQDPADHHLDSTVPELFKKMATGRNIETRWIEGGEHELTIGPRYKEVCEIVYEFINRSKNNAA